MCANQIPDVVDVFYRPLAYDELTRLDDQSLIDYRNALTTQANDVQRVILSRAERGAQPLQPTALASQAINYLEGSLSGTYEAEQETLALARRGVSDLAQ